MPPQQRTAPAAAQTQTKQQAPPPPSDFERLLTKDHRLEYEPFGGKGNIRLSVSIVQNLICVKTKTGKVCSENDALKFMAMCQAKRMNPFEGDCYLIGFDGRNGPEFSMITAHQTYLKRAELHPEFDGMRSGLIVQEGNEEEGFTTREIEGDFYEPPQQKVVGGWAEVFFKNRKVPMKKRLRLDRFRKPFGVWVDDAAGMICKCAEADSLRSSFPTMLGGLYMREEMEAQAVATVRPDFSPADILKKGKQALFTPATTATTATTATESEPPKNAASGPGSEPGPGFSEPEPSPVYARVRFLLGELTQGDNELLDYLTDIGTISDGVTTLYEVPSETLAMVIENWASISANLTDRAKATQLGQSKE